MCHVLYKSANGKIERVMYFLSLISNGSVLHSTNLMVSCEEYTSRILLSAQVAFPTSGGGEWLLKFFQ